MKNINKKILADIALFFATFLWGSAFAAVKETLTYITPFWLLSIRFSISFLLLFIIFRKRILKTPFTDIKRGLFLGLILFFAFTLQTFAYDYTGAGKIAFLTSTYVIMIPWLSLGIKKIFPALKVILASFVCLLGLYLLTIKETFALNPGDWLGVGCALFYALHIIVLEYYIAGKDPLSMASIQIGGIALISSFFAFFLETFPERISISAVLSLSYLILFCTIVAYIIQNTAQKYTTSASTSIILSFVSVFGALSGIIFFNEKFTPLMLAGSLLIFISVIISEFPENRLYLRKHKKIK